MRFALACVCLCGAEVFAADAFAADAPVDKKPEVPHAEQSVTRHTLRAGGDTLEYTGTAGALIVRDNDDKPIASLGYVAYTKRDVKDLSHRPVLFAFNGGPGAAAVWLNVGLLGPRRVLHADAKAAAPAPYEVGDNAFTLLDKADLVFIDPVGTGVSHAVGDKKDEDFWGVDEDIECVSRFIAQYLDDNFRWSSPKYLLGESYGTTRAAGVANWLQSERKVAFNGLILISLALDIDAIAFDKLGNDRPYWLYLPSFAAIALYHKRVPVPADRDAWLREVREFARGPYQVALSRGDAIGAAERTAVAQKLHDYTGVPAALFEASNLRVSDDRFRRELLRERQLAVGRLDARSLSAVRDPIGNAPESDPVMSALMAPFTAVFLDHYHHELNASVSKTYRVFNEALGEKFRMAHKVAGGSEQRMVNTGEDLADLLVREPNLRVLVLNGIYDLATPFAGAEFMIDHLGVPVAIRDHVSMKYYDAGHAIYVDPLALPQVKRDLDAFIGATVRK